MVAFDCLDDNRFLEFVAFKNDFVIDDGQRLAFVPEDPGDVLMIGHIQQIFGALFRVAARQACARQHAVANERPRGIPLHVLLGVIELDDFDLVEQFVEVDVNLLEYGLDPRFGVRVFQRRHRIRTGRVVLPGLHARRARGWSQLRVKHHAKHEHQRPQRDKLFFILLEVFSIHDTVSVVS